MATDRAPVVSATRDDRGRARFPDQSGTAVAADGVRIAWEAFGAGAPTLVCMPSAPIVHSRQWKGQVHYLSRHYRVVTYDGRGNGRSDRPTEPAAFSMDRFLGDLPAVLDATDTRQAVLIGLCGDSVWPSIQFAAANPDRVQGIVAFAVGVPLLTPPHPWWGTYDFDAELPTDEGWAKFNAHYWRRDYPGFARFFFEWISSEPHSTKLIDDAVEWAMEGSVDAMLADHAVEHVLDLATVERTSRAVRCPMLLVHGTLDHCQPIDRARRLAELTGAELVEVEGADHMIPGRHPVLANRLIRDFVERLPVGEVT